MALVVVGLALRQTRSERQKGSGPIQGLNLALLIYTQNQSPVGRIKVEPYDIAHLLFKLGVLGNLKLLDPVGQDIEALPNPMHHGARKTERAGEDANAPMRLPKGFGFHRSIA